MPRCSGFVRGLAAALLLFVSRSTPAQLLLATPEGTNVGIEHVELAYAQGDGAPITWLALRLSGDPVGIVAALPVRATAQAAADAWFQALEATAAPRVLLPRGESDCGDDASFLEVTLPRSPGVEPDQLELGSAAEVSSALADRGLAPSGPLPQAAKYVLWIFAGSERAATSRTLRVTGADGPLPFRAEFLVPLVLSAVTRGPARLAGEADASSLALTFVTGPERRHDYWEQALGWGERRGAPLLETRSRALLFDWEIFDDLVTVAPLVRSYASRAAHEVAGVDAERCAQALLALRDEPDFAAARDACGPAEDAWLALEAAGAELATLQRFHLAGAMPPRGYELEPGGEPQPPLVRASLLDDSACEPAPPEPPIVIGKPVPIGGIERPRDDEQGSEETVVVDEHHEEVGCSGGAYVEADVHDVPPDDDCSGESDEATCRESTSPGASSESCSTDSSGSTDDDCSADSSSSASSGDDCSADSSSSASSGDDCSSDTSGSSEPAEDDACAGDSSSSSDEGESCSGGPGGEADSGYDGDTCTGSAAPEPTEQSASPLRRRGVQRPRRVKVSLWSVALAALALPFRRRKRAP